MVDARVVVETVDERGVLEAYKRVGSGTILSDRSDTFEFHVSCTDLTSDDDQTLARVVCVDGYHGSHDSHVDAAWRFVLLQGTTH
jgi:hypothetical protein